MSMTDAAPDTAAPASAPRIDFKLEVLVIPVADVDRAAAFYADQLGWRVDADLRPPGGRIMQVTPPGSPASVIFGTGLTPSPPGSAKFLHLVVSDIEAADTALRARGVTTSGPFHDRAGGYNRFDPAARAPGPDPQRRTYASYATFEDPDGNLWVLQEITSRFPGRIEGGATRYASPEDLAAALRRAAVAHGEHESRIGGHDEGWPDWYAAWMAAEQSGAEKPA